MGVGDPVGFLADDEEDVVLDAVGRVVLSEELVPRAPGRLDVVVDTADAADPGTLPLGRWAEVVLEVVLVDDVRLSAAVVGMELNEPPPTGLEEEPRGVVCATGLDEIPEIVTCETGAVAAVFPTDAVWSWPDLVVEDDKAGS